MKVLYAFCVVTQNSYWGHCTCMRRSKHSSWTYLNDLIRKVKSWHVNMFIFSFICITLHIDQFISWFVGEFLPPLMALYSTSPANLHHRISHWCLWFMSISFLSLIDLLISLKYADLTQYLLCLWTISRKEYGCGVCRSTYYLGYHLNI
jgi:hypothetical protein